MACPTQHLVYGQLMHISQWGKRALAQELGVAH